jgi:superfamily I DNA/RNA helicase
MMAISLCLLSPWCSKGLEWDRVYLVRCNAGEMPLAGCVGADVSGMQLEEERRLCYVRLISSSFDRGLRHVRDWQLNHE